MSDDYKLKTAQDIVEKIMTQHWDIAACQCWICKAGRDVGLHPMEKHSGNHGAERLPLVELCKGIRL